MSAQRLCRCSQTFYSQYQVASQLTKWTSVTHTVLLNPVAFSHPILPPRRYKFLSTRDPDLEDKDKRVTLKHDSLFKEMAKKEKNKRTYQRAISKYLQHQGVQRRGHVEFIYAALDNMKEFQVEKDLAVYKQIIDLFPKEKMVAKTNWQREFMHYPKQQQCLIDVFDKMESNGVIPDDSLGHTIIQIFGRNTYPFRKYQRMMYWMPKFKYANPYYIPHQLPQDLTELAVMALRRMAVDLENVVTVFQADEMSNSVDPTFIASAQSPAQRELIIDHPKDLPLYVEGGFTTWLRDKCLTYFVLKSEQTQQHKVFMSQQNKNKDEDSDLTFKFTMFEEESSVVVQPTIHEQSEGTILGMCITGTSSKDSLASWIKALQRDNPRLSSIPIVFLLRTPETGLQSFNENKDSNEVSVPQDDNR